MYFDIILLLIFALILESLSESKFNFKNDKAQNDSNKNQLNGDYVELIKSEIKQYLTECANGDGGGDISGEDRSSERYPRRGLRNNQDDGNGSDGYNRNHHSKNFGQSHNKRQSFGGMEWSSSSHGGSERDRGNGGGSDRYGGGSDRRGGGGSDRNGGSSDRNGGGSDRYGGGSDRYGGGSDRSGGGSDRSGGGSNGYGGGSNGYGGGSDRDRSYGGGSDRYGGGSDYDRGYGHSDRDYGGRNRGSYDDEVSGDSRGGYRGQSRNNEYGRGYDNYGSRNEGNRDEMGGGRYGQSEYGSRPYGSGGNFGSYIRSKRSEGSTQCTSQCVFGYLEVLDDNRSPSESALMKWVHDNMQNDGKRIKAIREIRRCFGRLASSDKNDGCVFSKSLSNCMNLEIEN